MISLGYYVVLTRATRSVPARTLGCVVGIIGSTASVRVFGGTYEVPLSYLRLATDADMSKGDGDPDSCACHGVSLNRCPGEKS